MAKFHHLQICYILMVSLATLTFAEDDRQVYIVYMGNVPQTIHSLLSRHVSILEEVVDNSVVEELLVRSYTRSFNGFAAKLTAQQRQKLAGHDEVVSVIPNVNCQRQTTRSWDFLGFPKNVRRSPTVESDTIIGVIDTGIWPESESFNDKGFGPPPKKWKGACKGGANFTCNNKLIGARYYNNDSARDPDGHGTHAASTAAGNFVKDASFYGIAKGTARGAVPSARIAAYNVCSPFECQAADILAAFDDAIADGVDIITISITTPFPYPLARDPMAIGALHALQKGILVVQPAGNDEVKGSVSGVPPWIFTVAASHTDRVIVNEVVPRNGKALTGRSINSYNLVGSHAEVVYGNVSRNCSYSDAFACSPGCLEPSMVKRKILLCNNFYGLEEALKAGAIGAVALNVYGQNTTDDYAEIVEFPGSYLNSTDFNGLVDYFNSIRSRELDIFASKSVKNPDAPRVAKFSSRGPNRIIPNIMKPDITAPGVEILAAFSPLKSPSQSPFDKRSVKYSFLSGTSMACPHAAGAAAYVKSFHPDWSPAAIKSALMTTAKRMDSTGDPLAEFSYGAGQIDPVRAVHPGLVYDITLEDYIKFLCSLKYSAATLGKIFNNASITCTTTPHTTPIDLNYPAMTTRIETAQGNRRFTFSEKFRRTVTNVGHANWTYKAITSQSKEYKISVKPDVLTFGARHERKSFEVIISGKTDKEMVSASMEWCNGFQIVRSPILIYQHPI